MLLIPGGRRVNESVKNSVLLVGNFLSSTRGARSVCEEFAERLAAGGWSALTTSDKPGRTLRLLDMVTTAWQRRREYRVAQVDVFSGPAFFWAEAVCWTLRRINKPYVLTLRGGSLPAFGRRWPSRVRHLFSSAVAVVTPSGYLLESMKPYRGDLRLLPNPLDSRAYAFRVREQAQPRLVWLRAFHETYNPPLAPKVVALLAADFPHTHLTMVGRDKGDGSFERTERVAIELGVRDRLLLPGGVCKADVPTWINKGDIFLNTTNVDNTPISVLEAMACGLCVVSTNVGGIPYLLKDGHDALLVPPDDAQAMASAVGRILTDHALAERLSRNARQKAEQFDWKIIFPQWEELLMAVSAKD